MGVPYSYCYELSTNNFTFYRLVWLLVTSKKFDKMLCSGSVNFM